VSSDFSAGNLDRIINFQRQNRDEEKLKRGAQQGLGGWPCAGHKISAGAHSEKVKDRGKSDRQAAKEKKNAKNIGVTRITVGEYWEGKAIGSNILPGGSWESQSAERVSSLLGTWITPRLKKGVGGEASSQANWIQQRRPVGQNLEENNG